MHSNPKAYAEGLALLDKLHGGHTGAQMVAAMKDICPDFAR